MSENRGGGVDSHCILTTLATKSKAAYHEVISYRSVCRVSADEIDCVSNRNRRSYGRQNGRYDDRMVQTNQEKKRTSP